jgi:SAM-dependent methyltransferase
MNSDEKTAEAFATSWNNLPEGSVYNREQFEDWMRPLHAENIEGKDVLELGCGNGSLMVHMAQWMPRKLVGVDLGDSVLTAKENLKEVPNVTIKKDDLVTFEDKETYDLVYCIGVLHHLQKPEEGFESVVRNTKDGGRFHCWVYAREGNAIIRYVVDPIRKVSCKLPWWVTKHFLATPLVVPFYVYAKVMRVLPRWQFLYKLPLYEYALWISQRDYLFFRHAAFDQLVTPQTTYIPRNTIKKWLKSNDRIDQSSTYIIMRNGNSWKFGGRVIR